MESSYDLSPSNAWGANVNYFITPAVSVGATYVNADYKAKDDKQDAAADKVVLDTQTVGLNAKFRF